MKKIYLTVLFLLIALVLSGCGNTTTYEIALITDYVDITDKSYNQTSWEAVKEYAELHNKTYTYYRPAGDNTAERVAKIEQAIGKGAKVIIVPGFAFSTTIAQIQDEYPDVKFICLDVTKKDVEMNYYTEESRYTDNPVLKDPSIKAHLSDNVACSIFREEEAGYLAGYAAVMNGERDLGFLGGMAVPAVIRFGNGYVQGIKDASTKLNVEINLWHVYAGIFGPNPKVQGVMEQWGNFNGKDDDPKCKTVFACGGEIFLSVVSAYKGHDGYKLIGVDTDQTKNVTEMPVLTSAIKGLKEVIFTSLDDFYNGWTIGGKEAIYGLKEARDKEYVGLPRDTYSMENFTLADYDNLVKEIRDGKVIIDSDFTKTPDSFLEGVTNIHKINTNFAGTIL